MNEALKKAKEALEKMGSLIRHQYTGSSEAMTALQEADNLAHEALSALSKLEQEPEWYTGVDGHGCRRFYHKDEVRPGIGFDEQLYTHPIAPVAAQEVASDQIVKIAEKHFGKYAYEAKSLFLDFVNDLLLAHPCASKDADDARTAFYEGYGEAVEDARNGRLPVIETAWKRTRAALAKNGDGNG
jgi:hypothetical protein